MPSDRPRSIFLYTDGACSSNRIGGWGYIAVYEGKELHSECGGVHDTTNNRMELTAILFAMVFALREGFDNVIVVTDSKYSRDAISRKWGENETIKNADLIGQIKSLVATRKQCRIEWIKGHNGHKWNEAADKLAVRARASIMLD